MAEEFLDPGPHIEKRDYDVNVYNSFKKKHGREIKEYFRKRDKGSPATFKDFRDRVGKKNIVLGGYSEEEVLMIERGFEENMRELREVREKLDLANRHSFAVGAFKLEEYLRNIDELENPSFEEFVEKHDFNEKVVKSEMLRLFKILIEDFKKLKESACHQEDKLFSSLCDSIEEDMDDDYTKELNKILKERDELNTKLSEADIIDHVVINEDDIKQYLPGDLQGDYEDNEAIEPKDLHPADAYSIKRQKMDQEISNLFYDFIDRAINPHDYGDTKTPPRFDKLTFEEYKKYSQKSDANLLDESINNILKELLSSYRKEVELNNSELKREHDQAIFEKREEIKNNPKKAGEIIFEKHFNVDQTNGSIQFFREGIFFVMVFENESDYLAWYHNTLDITGKSKSGGFYAGYRAVNINAKERSITVGLEHVVNVNDGNAKRKENVLEHERQHAINHYFLGKTYDKEKLPSTIERLRSFGYTNEEIEKHNGIKDEMMAFLVDGELCKRGDHLLLDLFERLGKKMSEHELLKDDGIYRHWWDGLALKQARIWKENIRFLFGLLQKEELFRFREFRKIVVNQLVDIPLPKIKEHLEKIIPFYKERIERFEKEFNLSPFENKTKILREKNLLYPNELADEIREVLDAYRKLKDRSFLEIAVTTDTSPDEELVSQSEGIKVKLEKIFKNGFVCSDMFWVEGDEKSTRFLQTRKDIFNVFCHLDQENINDFYLDVASGGNGESLAKDHFADILNQIELDESVRLDGMRFKALNHDLGNFSLEIMFDIDGIKASTAVSFYVPEKIRKEGLNQKPV